MSLGASNDRDQSHPSALLEASRPSVDGRHLRAERSRQKIVNALTEIIRDGTMEPTQAEVAERAKVSFRTVSRHFEDMESLFRLCVRQVQTELLDQFLAPFESTHWRDRVDELIRRRAEGFDVFLPYRVFAAVRRFRSDFMRHIHDDAMVFDMTSLAAVLPPEIQEDPVLLDAIDNAISFESWARLRQGRQLSSEHALAVFMQTASSLLAQFEK